MQQPPYGQPMMSRPPSELAKRFDHGAIAAIVVVIAGIAFIGASLVTTWWSAKWATSTTTTTLDFGLGQACLSGPVNACYAYPSDLPQSMVDSFTRTGFFLMAGMILTVLALVLLILGALRPKVGWVAVICGMIASALTLVAPLYLLTTLPGAVSDSDAFHALYPHMKIDSFFGSYNTPVGILRFGGGLGWYLALFAFLLLMFGTIQTLLTIRRIAPMGNYRFGSGQQAFVTSAPMQQPRGGLTPIQYSPPAASIPPPPQPQAAPVTQKQCPTCGDPVLEGQPFCGRCGNKIG